MILLTSVDKSKTCFVAELSTFSYAPWRFVLILGVTSVYTVNNQQKVCTMNAIISIFKNWLRWGDIILLTLQQLIIKRKFKSVKALTNYFQHTSKNSYPQQYYRRVKYHYSNVCLYFVTITFYSIHVKTNLERDMRIWGEKRKILRLLFMVYIVN